MYKRIIIIFILLFSILSTTLVFWGDCKFTSDLKTWIDACLNDTNLVEVTDAKIEWGFKTKLTTWTKTIAWIFLLFAVWSIVFGWAMMTLSWWEEDKIKKWKDIVKWGIAWALGIVWAGTIITIIIQVMFEI